VGRKVRRLVRLEGIDFDLSALLDKSLFQGFLASIANASMPLMSAPITLWGGGLPADRKSSP
jgi:hypothetical protein